MCELLAASFSAVFVTETLQNSVSCICNRDSSKFSNPQRFGGMLEEVLLSPVAVAGLLLKFDSSASGPNGLHPCLLKGCNVALSWPLYLLYVKSLDEGLLSSVWKASIIVSLFKNGSRCNPLNYRLVSLTSMCCK